MKQILTFFFGEAAVNPVKLGGTPALRTSPSKKKPKYTTAEEGEWVEPHMKGFKHACCDCGLVHKMNFRLTDKDTVQFQVFRDARATGAMRRGFRFERE